MRRKCISKFLLSSFLMLTLLISIFSGSVTGFAAEGGSDPAAAEAARLTVVHTNDTHSRVKEGDGIGFAKISTIIK